MQLPEWLAGRNEVVFPGLKPAHRGLAIQARIITN
jgi:hypothetical protein